MKVVKIKMELVMNDFHCSDDDCYDKNKIAEYLNDMLYNHPEFFGVFTEYNIVDVYEGC